MRGPADENAEREEASWGRTVETIHRSIAGETGIAERLRKVADTFLGRRYVSDPIVGGSGSPEKLVVELEFFDCVTLIEIALALARSRTKKSFLDELRETRYRNGRVDWSSRHHYFADWMKYNEKRGAVRIRTRGVGSRPIASTLGWIEGLPERRARFHVVPKKDIAAALGRISNGSIVAFASVRAKLDFFHTGLLFFPPGGLSSVEELTLYQARRSAGKVIEEPLVDFLKRNRMRGIAFAQPLS